MKTFQEVTEGSEIDEKKMPADLKRKQQQKRKKWQALGKKHPDKKYLRKLQYLYSGDLILPLSDTKN